MRGNSSHQRVNQRAIGDQVPNHIPDFAQFRALQGKAALEQDNSYRTVK